MSNVVCVRLVNGDEVMGRMDDDQSVDAASFTLKKVRHLLVQQTREGLGVTLMPWSFCNIDGDVTISRHGVLAVLNPAPETVTNYLEQTTSIKLAL